MTYYVVLYENYCLTVPSSWVDIDHSTFRMPHKHKNLTQACIKQISPSDDWNEVAFKIKFGPYESYKSARDTEKKLSELSASDDNLILPEKNNSNKRLIKKRTFLGDTSSEEDGRKKSKISRIPSNYVPQMESEYSIKSQSKSIPLPISQSLNDLEDDESDRSESATYSSEEEKETLENSHSSQQTLENSHFSQRTLENSHSSQQTLKNSHASQAMKGKSKTLSQVMSDIRIQPRISFENDTRDNCELDPFAELLLLGDCNSITERRDYNGDLKSCLETHHKDVMKKLSIIARSLSSVIQFIKNSSQIESEGNLVIQIEDHNLLPNFPLTTIKQLKEFDTQLKNIAVRQQFIQKMSKIGGENVAKTVRNILSECIGHEVAQIYTWTGQKKKPALKDCEISKAIVETVMKKDGTTTISQIETFIKEWLRRGSNRLRSLLNKR